jgi:hypothetical protein
MTTRGTTVMHRMTGCLISSVALVGVGCGPGRVAGPAPDLAAAARLAEVLSAAESSSDTGEAAAATGTGWAMLKGRFTFAGSPGEKKALVVDKDMAVCSKDGMKLYDQSLRVDEPTKGLADVVLFVRKANRVKDPVPAEPLVFDQKNCEFLSPVFAARVGQPVDVRNSDPIGHNTNVSGTSFNQLIPAGEGTLYTPTAETGMPVSVTCNIHPWMKAYAVFRKDGYVAVSAVDGSFALADLPAGELLEFQVWHARSASGLKLDRPDLKWSPKGRFQITLQPDEVKDLGTLEVPAAALGG